jgi:peptide chain release factor subunit 1
MATTTISLESLRELAAFRAEKGCAISLYLNLDPSEVPTAGDAQTRMNSMLHAADRVDRTDLTHEQRMGLKGDFERIAQWFDDDFERDGSQGLAVFAAGLDNSWRTLALPAPVEDRAKVGHDFFLTPLAPLIGRADGTIVAVVSREQGQLYRLSGGRLEEIAEHYDETPGQHDQGGWSQARYQRHIEKLVHEHLKGVAEELDRTRRQLHGPKIVLVCAEEMRTEFLEALSAEARTSLVGWTPAQSHASPAELLSAVKPVLEEAESKSESEAIERWREEAGRNGRAASGWEQTLEAASDARVELLLFQQGVDRPAFRCPACGRAAVSEGSCPLDGTRLEPTDAGLDLAVHQTLAHGGAVWAIRHHEDLAPVEGIGALLRF